MVWEIQFDSTWNRTVDVRSKHSIHLLFKLFVLSHKVVNQLKE